MGETKLREQQEKAVVAARARECEHSSSHLLLKIVGGMALAVVVAGIVASLPDIRRYIKISTM